MKKRTTITGGICLQDQWNRFVKNPVIANFTNSLYDAMYFRPGFIAHYNKEGFYNNRFTALSQLDYTLEIMTATPELKELIDNTNPMVLGNMRFTIAQKETNRIELEIKIKQRYLEDLQSQFQWKL